MKQLILIKTCPEIQLAHLYEHMYGEAIIRFMHDKNYLSYLDYRWHGTTYEGGFIHIRIELYTSRAQKAAFQLKNLDIPLDDQSIGKKALQLVAEKQRAYGAENKENLREALQELHTRPWQTMNEFIVHDYRQLKRSQNILWISDKKAQTKVLRLDFFLDTTFDAENKRLLALFGIITSILQNSLSDGLSVRYAFYEYDESSRYSGMLAKETTKMRVFEGISPELNGVSKKCKQLLRELMQAGMVSGIDSWLQKNDYYEQPWDPPDELRIFEKCGVLLGAKGWRDIASEKNIKKVIQHTTLQLTFGRQKQRLALKKLL